MLVGLLAIEIKSPNFPQFKVRMFASVDAFLFYMLLVVFFLSHIFCNVTYILHVYKYMNKMYVTL